LHFFLNICHYVKKKKNKKIEYNRQLYFKQKKENGMTNKLKIYDFDTEHRLHVYNMSQQKREHLQITHR